jgi:hypothetical protein
MTADIVTLPTSRPKRTPVGHAIRSGESAYRQLETLHAEGRLPVKTLIVDASRAKFQKEFISAIRESGGEVILDTKCAELSEIGRCNGLAKGAPWAQVDEQRPLIPSDYQPGANIDLFSSIANFAVELGVNAVMAPTHFLRDGVNDKWWPIDKNSIGLLRAALDRAGGEAIGIDYPLIVRHTLLQDADHRRGLVTGLTSLPIDNLVVRLSGFGASAAPLAMKRTFAALRELQLSGHPILLDHVGGLIGVGALALGCVSGIGHGIGEREQFDAGQWHKVPKKRDPDAPGGRAVYVPLPGFDRNFSKKDLELITATPKGRRLASCADKSCCPHGLKSMQDNLKGHIAVQRFKSVGAIDAVPDNHRAQHFLDNEMRSAERKARDLAQLTTGDDKVDMKLAKGRKRIDSLARTFETLTTEPIEGGPLPIIKRGKPMRDLGVRSI